MARPKRQRNEVASIELPPTTRRRRSNLESPAIGVGGKADHSSTTSGTIKSVANENTMNMDEDDCSKSNKIQTSKKNAASHTSSTTDEDVVDGDLVTLSNATTNNTTNNNVTSNDPGNDHADDDDYGKKKTSLIDANALMEPPMVGSQTSLRSNNSNVSNTKKNKTTTSNSTSKVVHSTTTTAATSAGTTITATSTGAVVTTRRSSHGSQTTMSEPSPVDVLTNDSTIKGGNRISSNGTAVEVSSEIISIAEEPMIPPGVDLSTTGTTVATTASKRLQKDDIVALLQHRQILLQRIRQCRKVTEQRLGTDQVRNIDAEHETILFSDTMKQVLSQARKQSRLEQQQRDNNDNSKHTGHFNPSTGKNVVTTTVSLRRGNSVGKRMNAAISTLTGTSTSSSYQQQQQQQLGSSDVVPLQLASILNSTNNALNPSSGSTTGTGDTVGLTTTKMSQYKNSSSTVVGGTIPSTKNASKRPDSAMGRSMSKKTQNSRGSNDSYPQQQRQQRINTESDGGTFHHHQQQQQSYTSTNNTISALQHPQQDQNRVVCPETMALRKRRDEIRNILSTLLASRHNAKLGKAVSLTERRNSLASHVSASSLSPRSTAISWKPIVTSMHRTSKHGVDKNRHKLPSTSAFPRWEIPDGPPTCPPRRKTHWDTVLEEMRWMATDFIEEQKWKYAAARVLSAQASSVVKEKSLPTNSNEKQSVVETIEQSLTSDVVRLGCERNMEIINKESRSAGTMTASTTQPTNFQPMTNDDIISARNVAKQVSGMISDMVHLNNTSSGPSIASSSGVSHNNSQSTAVIDEFATTEPLPEFRKEKAEFIERVSSHIDHIAKTTTTYTCTVDEKRKLVEEALNTNEIQPSNGQLKIIHTIEDRWERVGVGSVLHGPRSSGKTIVACSVLHRNRSHGPQLLICSAASLIRWKHELGQFRGLQIKQWNESYATACFHVNDVVLCPRSCMLNLPVKDLPKFATVILDCRYSKQSNQLRLNGVRTEQSICVPNDLSSPAWWKSIIELISTSNVDRRLLVDSFDSDCTITYLRGLTSKEYLTVTAFRTAFLIGPKWFQTQMYPIEKAVLAWARQRTKQQGTVGSKFTQVKALLFQTSAFGHISTGAETDNAGLLGKYIAYEVRNCVMSKTQQLAYNRACQQSRLTLSMELENQDEKAFDDIAACLLLLRRQCFHSDIDSILRQTARIRDHMKESVDSLPNKYLFLCSAAQPDINLGHRILNGSSKLRHLVSILRHNDEFELLGLSEGKKIIGRKINDKEESNQLCKKKKIAIIAALPEIQLLVSCLLHSLGIQHETLTDLPAWSSQNLRYHKDSFSWTKFQTLLSNFNNRADSNLYVVIASLVTVEGDQVGLGIESADTIILMDENWSGQDERLLQSLISRCSLKRKLECRSSVDVIRLVTACTCEETFLRNGDDARNPAGTKINWDIMHNEVDAMNASEVKKVNQTPTKETKGQQESNLFMFCFSRQNIFRYRNKSLNEILRPSQPLSRLRQLSTHHRFLPLVSDDESKDIETKIMSYVVRMEGICKVCSDQPDKISSTIFDEIQSWHDARDCLPPIPLRNFVRRQYQTMALQENGSSLPLTVVTLAVKGVIPTVEVSDNVERESRSVLDRSPGEVAISMLLYDHDDSCTKVDTTTNTAISHRGNRYATSFSATSAGTLRHDGNQGVEALVYFPPLVPKLREFVDTAIDERPQYDETVTDENTKTLSVPNNGNQIAVESMSMDDDFGLVGRGILPSIQDSISAAANTVYQSGYSYAESIDSLNVWLSTITPINAEEYQTKLQQRFVSKPMKSVILVVSRKRVRGQSNVSYQARYGTGIWNGISPSMSEISHSVDINGISTDINGMNKKGKRNVSAFNRLPLVDTPQHVRPTTFAFHRKDDYRHRLLSTLRQSSASSGSTIFEAPIFRVAAIRIRDKISDRLQHQAWSTTSTRVNDKSRSGLPIVSRSTHEGDAKRYTSIVSRSQKQPAVVDEQILALARQQVISFQKSLSEPRRVDFGPFQSGFFSSSSGMTSVTFPRARIGVTLPMGVKISILSKEQTAVQWSSDMDRILSSAIDRFGTNWILASRLLKSFFGLSYLHKESNFYRVPCAPRHCRDRWRLLTKDDMSNNRNDTVRIAQRMHYVGDAGSRKILSNVECKSEILLPTSIDNAVPTKVASKILLENESSPAQQKSSRRKFTAFQLGSAKRQNMPVPITGVASAIAPCHPSHEVTVQMSTMAVNGRTDMWPLQILDGADRLRTAAANTVVVESSASNGSSLSSRRPASLPPRPHNSGSNGRSSLSQSQTNHRSQSVTAAQVPVPVQRTPSSSGTSSSHRPTSQHMYPTNHVTTSQQRFVPPIPPAKVIPVSTPKVQSPTSSTMPPPPPTIASQPAPAKIATNSSTSQPPAVATKAAVTATSHTSGTIIPSATSNGTVSADKIEPLTVISVPPPQGILSQKTTTIPASVEQIQPSNPSESDTTKATSVPAGTVDVTATTVSKVPETATNTMTDTISIHQPSTDTNVVPLPTTDESNVHTEPANTTKAVANTVLPSTSIVPTESTPVAKTE